MVMSLMSFLAYFSFSAMFEGSSLIYLYDARLWFLFLVGTFFLTTNFRKN